MGLLGRRLWKVASLVVVLLTAASQETVLAEAVSPSGYVIANQADRASILVADLNKHINRLSRTESRIKPAAFIHVLRVFRQCEGLIFFDFASGEGIASIETIRDWSRRGSHREGVLRSLSCGGHLKNVPNIVNQPGHAAEIANFVSDMMARHDPNFISDLPRFWGLNITKASNQNVGPLEFEKRIFRDFRLSSGRQGLAGRSTSGVSSGLNGGLHVQRLLVSGASKTSSFGEKSTSLHGENRREKNYQNVCELDFEKCSNPMKKGLKHSDLLFIGLFMILFGIRFRSRRGWRSRLGFVLCCRGPAVPLLLRSI